MTTIVVSSSEERCHELAESEGLKPEETIYAWDIASFLRCTGLETHALADEEMYSINIADWILMMTYNDALIRNKYNGFGLREIYPERADQSILDLVAWVNSEQREIVL